MALPPPEFWESQNFLREMQRMDYMSRDNSKYYKAIYGQRVPPIELHWMGWRTTTDKLQQHGWQFAESKHDTRGYSRVHQLRFRHPAARVTGETDYWEFHPDMMRDRYHYHPSMGQIIIPPLKCIINMNNIYHIHQRESLNFRPVDCHPSAYQMRPSEEEIVDGYRATYFRHDDRPPTKLDAKQIFLEKASMQEILDLALAKQEPTQKEIRARMLKEKKLAEINQAGRIEAQLRLVQ